MCGFLGSYLGLRLGSLIEAMGDFCSTNSGLMARSPETAWEEGMMAVGERCEDIGRVMARAVLAGCSGSKNS
jgi:hypothetical protein